MLLQAVSMLLGISIYYGNQKEHELLRVIQILSRNFRWMYIKRPDFKIKRVLDYLIGNGSKFLHSQVIISSEVGK